MYCIYMYCISLQMKIIPPCLYILRLRLLLKSYIVIGFVKTVLNNTFTNTHLNNSILFNLRRKEAAYPTFSAYL